MTGWKRNAVDYLVYLVVRVVVCLVQAMPIEAGYAVARSLSRVHSGGLPRYALGSFIGLALIVLLREAMR